MAEKQTTLWAIRFSPVRGWQVIRERDCDAKNAQLYLDVFQSDEPQVAFKVSDKKPKMNEDYNFA
jgi:hypothetical protein